jgi:hypothetical protein
MAARRRPVVTSLSVALLTAPVLAACGGGDRPSVPELTAVILSGKSRIAVADDQAECTAQVLVSSDLSDAMLRSYVDDTDWDGMTEEDGAAWSRVLERLDEECDVQQGAG